MAIFLEYIRKRLGWCPNVAATGIDRRRYAVPEAAFGTRTAAGGEREVVEGVLVDYGPIGTPGIYLVLLVAGALLIGCFFVLPQAGGRLLLAIILAAYSGVELYGVVQKASIEIARGIIVIRRPFFRPIVIPKDAVVKAEVRENKPPVPSWIFAAALTALLVSAAGSIYSGFSNPASMRFIFGFAAAIFFLVIFYRTYARAHYPQTLTITTAEKKIAAIYTDDPERIARTLEVSR
ncbi:MULTISPECIES: hypothetical protein [unclassified Methanoculleus]|jgi:hypothetical protein|uniref:hypothetical protein n=1 Tax=unclassified Methanoculleus TaxID=2619537 RepID=UPI00319E5101